MNLFLVVKIMFEKLQRLGKAFMIPIAVLPIAGLVLGIGSAFSNGLMIETYGLTVKGVFRKGNGVQVVYGALAEVLKNDINKVR